jgi:hypothetical protein
MMVLGSSIRSPQKHFRIGQDAASNYSSIGLSSTNLIFCHYSLSNINQRLLRELTGGIGYFNTPIAISSDNSLNILIKLFSSCTQVPSHITSRWLFRLLPFFYTHFFFT